MHPEAPSPRLPAKADFAGMNITYLDSGTTHPVSLGAKARIEAYLAARSCLGGQPAYSREATETRVLQRFARLINADVDEVCYVPNTTTAEHLVIRSLGLTNPGERIVTDVLHFFGSIYLYHELAKQGVEVAWLQAKDGRIELADIKAAVTKKTKLVVLSLVSAVNGFQHDLKEVCGIAHANGAYVYADIAHAAGCVPIDVKNSGVDFAACPSFKWLMGDFGLGFLYVKRDALRALRRVQFGYQQLTSWRTVDYPIAPPTESLHGYAPRDDATGHFAMGTLPHSVLAQLDWSLEYISEIGVNEIQNYRQPMLRRLKAELPRLGYPLMTPEETMAPLVVCQCRERAELERRLSERKIKIAVYQNRLRVSPSVFNDMADVDELLNALS
jgi:selenocysteine lyase/cysteine desulfurase